MTFKGTIDFRDLYVADLDPSVSTLSGNPLDGTEPYPSSMTRRRGRMGSSDGRFRYPRLRCRLSCGFSLGCFVDRILGRIR